MRKLAIVLFAADTVSARGFGALTGINFVRKRPRLNYALLIKKSRCLA